MSQFITLQHFCACAVATDSSVSAIDATFATLHYDSYLYTVKVVVLLFILAGDCLIMV